MINPLEVFGFQSTINVSTPRQLQKGKNGKVNKGLQRIGHNDFVMTFVRRTSKERNMHKRKIMDNKNKSVLVQRNKR